MLLKVKTTTYIYPPRPNTAVPFKEAAFFAEIGWQWQYKINDTRCMIKYTPEKIELWNRHAEQMRSYHCPDWLRDQLLIVREHLQLNPNKISILDGGLYDQKHAAIKDTICIWDILVRDDEQLLGTTYTERYNQIAKGTTPYNYSHPTYKKPIQFGKAYTPETTNVFHLLNNPQPTPQQTWDQVQQVNKPFAPNSPLLEGMVFKDPQGILEMGLRPKNNHDWQCRCRVKTGRHNF